MLKKNYIIIIYFMVLCILVTFYSLISSVSHNQTDVRIMPIASPIEIQRNLLMELIGTYNPNLYEAQKMALCNTILQEAKQTGLHPFFISSVIAAESSFDPDAVSPCAAMGLMQLTSCVLDDLHIKEPFNIQANIYGGTRFLKYLKEQFQNDSLVLAAYNAGPTLVSRLGRIPRIPETIDYVKKVTSLFHGLQQKMTNSIHDLLVKSIYFSDLFQNQSPEEQPNSLLLDTHNLTYHGIECGDICETENLFRRIFTS